MLQLSTQFPQKRAFITGTGSGLGKALTLLLAEDGWTIGISDINVDALDATAKEAQAKGATTHSYVLDVANREQFQAVAEQFVAKVGGIDLLVNNAGVGDGGPFQEYALENWDWMVGVNQWGVVHGCFFFVKQFQQQKAGHIINIASAAGFAHPPNMSAYNTTKAAVRAFSKTLYYELQDFNVMVSTVMPTFFKTNIMSDGRGSQSTISFGRKMIDRSGIEAAVIAKEILERAGKKEQEIVLPKEARRTYWMVRFLPRWFDKQVLKMAEKRKKKYGA